MKVEIVQTGDGGVKIQLGAEDEKERKILYFMRRNLAAAPTVTHLNDVWGVEVTLRPRCKP